MGHHCCHPYATHGHYFHKMHGMNHLPFAGLALLCVSTLFNAIMLTVIYKMKVKKLKVKKLKVKEMCMKDANIESLDVKNLTVHNKVEVEAGD